MRQNKESIRFLRRAGERNLKRRLTGSVLSVLTVCLLLLLEELFGVLSGAGGLIGKVAVDDGFCLSNRGGRSVCAAEANSPSGTLADLSVLPQGTKKPALAVPYFPDRSYLFVWRNWNLIEIDRLAAVLKTSPEKIAEIAELEGLPKYRKPTWPISQIYITLVRRNWHILPYEQLLTLLDMTPERLAFNLKEDDFLWHKLGHLKPVCEPVYYKEPSESDKKALQKIAQTVREELGASFTDRDEDPRFHFIDELKSIDPEYKLPVRKQSRFSLRYIYSYFALFGDPLLDDKAEIFPDGLLQKLSQYGINGVWLHVVLRDLAPGGDYFTEFGAGHEKRIANLKKLVAKAKKYGIGIYLYMNEPRAMPDKFFEKYPEVRGAKRTALGTFALCTSTPQVRKWLQDSLRFLFTEVPDLGGIFSITASENFTNCASHGKTILKGCPRCSEKGYAEVIADVSRMMEEAVHSAAPNAKVIVWDWGWEPDPDGLEIIGKLPKNVWQMSVSEKNLPLHRGGIDTVVGEYSISSVGPGPYAKKHWEESKKNGLKTAAKVQFNTTWEIGSVPYIPAMDLVASHCRNLAESGVDVIMTSWSLGGHPSMNLRIPLIFDRDPLPTVDQALDELARELGGEKGAESIRKGWSTISRAFSEFPFSGTSIVYLAPIQIGPANPLYLTPTGYSATMVGIPYDSVTSWRGPYPPDVFAAQFEKMEKGFLVGSGLLEKGSSNAPDQKQKEIREQARYAKTIGLVYGSTADQVKFVQLRDRLLDPKTTDTDRAAVKKQMIAICRNEIERAGQMYRLTKEDSRIGFESTNHYWYVPIDLVEKIINCRWIIEQLSR